jgi:chromosome segregation ATPase
MNPHELKQMQVRKTKAEAEVATLKDEMRRAQQAFQEAENRLTALNKQIADASKEPVVTEHALLRYVERVMGLDLDQVKSEILTDDTIKLMKTLGDGKYPIHDGHKAVVKGMNVVSIV